MPIAQACIIFALGLVASAVGAVFGGNSLLVVPVLMLLGLTPERAIATNMVALTLLSASASLRFERGAHIPRHPTAWLVVLAVPASLLGARLAVTLPGRTLSSVVGVAICAMALLLVLQLLRTPRDAPQSPSPFLIWVGYAAMALWSVYGGLFSGGYTTVLTMSCVFFFGTTLLQAIALSKVVNLASSGAASLLFLWHGAVDWPVALVLGSAMVIGGWLGAHAATRLPVRALQSGFAVAVFGLGVALLLRR